MRHSKSNVDEMSHKRTRARTHRIARRGLIRRYEWEHLCVKDSQRLTGGNKRGWGVEECAPTCVPSAGVNNMSGWLAFWQKHKRKSDDFCKVAAHAVYYLPSWRVGAHAHFRSTLIAQLLGKAENGDMWCCFDGKSKGFLFNQQRADISSYLCTLFANNSNCSVWI